MCMSDAQWRVRDKRVEQNAHTADFIARVTDRVYTQSAVRTCQLLATQTASRDSSAAIGSRTRLQVDVRPRHRPGTMRPTPRRAGAAVLPTAGDAAASGTFGGRVPLPVRVAGAAAVVVDRSQVCSSSSTRLYLAADEQTEHGRHRAVPPSDEPAACWNDVDDGGGGGGGTGSGNACADDECVKLWWRHLLFRDICTTR